MGAEEFGFLEAGLRPIRPHEDVGRPEDEGGDMDIWACRKNGCDQENKLTYKHCVECGEKRVRYSLSHHVAPGPEGEMSPSEGGEEQEDEVGDSGEEGEDTRQEIQRFNGRGPGVQGGERRT